MSHNLTRQVAETLGVYSFGSIFHLGCYFGGGDTDFVFLDNFLWFYLVLLKGLGVASKMGRACGT